MAGSFRFRQFEVRNETSALKVGTDAVLLGAAMTVRAEDRHALDIGTGTGVIALMAAQRNPDCHIDAIDIDAPSVEEAAYNFSRSPWPGSLEAIHVPLKEYIPGQPLDLVFSNPPFYDNSLKNPDAREAAARHTDSLQVKDICAFCAAHLSDGGRLSLILPAEEETRLRRIAASFGLELFRIIRIRTTATKAARRIIAEFSRKKSSVSEESLTLQEGSARTAEYSALTAEFYL